MHTGIIKEAKEHPAKKLFDAGVKIAFCADNVLLSQTTMRREQRIAKRFLGFTESDIKKCEQYSDDARFLEMTDLIACLSTGKGTWIEVSKIMKAG